MSTPATFLRRVLAVDSIGCAAFGFALIVGASWVAAPLGVPAAWLEAAGLALLPFAAFLGWLAGRAAPPAGAVWAAIAINAAWIVDSLLLAAGAAGPQPTTLGMILIGGQALIVATLAELEYVGMKRLRLRAA